MKKIFIALVAAFAIAVTGCSSNKSRGQPTFVEYKTPRDAAEIAGFPFRLPSPPPFSYKKQQSRAIRGDMVETVYILADDEICIRKGKGYRDVSGDNSSYPVSKKLVLGGVLGKMKGEAKDSYNVATWSKERFSYSITSKAGLTENMVLSIANYVD